MIYTYPELDNKRTGTFLTFTSYDYRSATGTSQKNFKTDKISNYLNSVNKSIQNGKNQNNNSGNSNNNIFDEAAKLFTNLTGDTLNKVVEGITPNQQPKESINLYLPPKLEYQYSANWQKVQLGALAAGTSVGGAGGVAAATTANSLFNAASGILSNVPKLENVSLDSLIGATLGISFNDNTVQTFDKMNPRNFSFEYIMVARNQKEKDEIKNIITSFKLGMHPTRTNSGGNKGLFLGYPAVWRIQPSGTKSTFKVRDKFGRIIEDSNGSNLIEFLPKTDLCALTDVKVDYTPENNIALIKGGFVQAVRLSLSFTELITLTREDLAVLEKTKEVI